jgi:hypothetical protein
MCMCTFVGFDHSLNYDAKRRRKENSKEQTELGKKSLFNSQRTITVSIDTTMNQRERIQICSGIVKDDDNNGRFFHYVKTIINHGTVLFTIDCVYHL